MNDDEKDNELLLKTEIPILRDLKRAKQDLLGKVIRLRPDSETFTLPVAIEIEDDKFVLTLEALKDPELRDKVIAKYQAELREKMQEYEGVLRLSMAIAEGRYPPKDL